MQAAASGWTQKSLGGGQSRRGGGCTITQSRRRFANEDVSCAAGRSEKTGPGKCPLHLATWPFLLILAEAVSKVSGFKKKKKVIHDDQVREQEGKAGSTLGNKLAPFTL